MTAAQASPPASQLERTVAEHDQVLSRRVLAEMGISRWQIRSEVRARRWQVVGRHAVVMYRGPLGPEQRRRVCLLHAGPGAVLSGCTALAVSGLSGWDDGTVQVLVPKGRLIPPLPGMAIHETRRFPDDYLGSPPRSRVERAAVDAAIRITQPRVAAALLAAVVQQRLTLPERVAAELAAAGRVRHRRLLTRVLDDIAGGAQALTEIDFAELCRRHGLPQPRRQVRRRGASGTIRYSDAEWRLPDGRIVRAEIDGALHLVPQQYWSDMARDNDDAIDGQLVLRFPSVSWWLDEAGVVNQLRRALAPLIFARAS